MHFVMRCESHDEVLVAATEIMKMLDVVDYTFLGFCVSGFLICVCGIWRVKPYRQIERKPVEPNEVFEK